MSNGFPTREQVERIRKQYPKGARVILVRMDDPYTKLKLGDKGFVTGVDDAGSIHIDWDNGSTLACIYGEDEVRIIEQ